MPSFSLESSFINSTGRTSTVSISLCFHDMIYYIYACDERKGTHHEGHQGEVNSLPVGHPTGVISWNFNIDG